MTSGVDYLAALGDMSPGDAELVETFTTYQRSRSFSANTPVSARS